jgi:hypothetical protein
MSSQSAQSSTGVIVVTPAITTLIENGTTPEHDGQSHDSQQLSHGKNRQGATMLIVGNSNPDARRMKLSAPI